MSSQGGDDDLSPLVAAFLSEWTNGSPPDLDAFCSKHPEAGQGLRERLEDVVYVRTALGARRPALPNLGHWQVVSLLGEGGMGTVYLAEQREPIQRQAAIKVAKPGLDSGEVLARFEAERQALARMDHPNVARVLEAGMSADGRPYFAMELVRGQPITVFCDEHHLPLADRLCLFVDVCRGVQHAHERGVLHRDIKPSNVLVIEVDGRPVPKLIDFGIAKALATGPIAGTGLTGIGRVLGTPEYMSPEQWTGGEVELDQRCDVYALGALLHELLVGVPALDRQRLPSTSWLEIHRFLMAHDPPAPSTLLRSTPEAAAIAARRSIGLSGLQRALRGDLDWIVRTAIARERERRYESAGALADDVERHLRLEPVRARRATWVYVASRFARRWRGWLLSLLVAVLALVLGFRVARSWAARGKLPCELKHIFTVRLGHGEADVGCLRAVGDVLAIGSASDSTFGASAGIVRVVSERNGSKICDLVGDPESGDSFGHALDAALDRSGDPEILVGAFGNDRGGPKAGAAFLYRGKDGQRLHLWVGDAAGDQFGEAVAAAGDLDCDGTGDWLVGAPADHHTQPSAAGYVRAFSGDKDQGYRPLWKIQGSAPGSKFGHSIAALGDVDGDGSDDFVVAAPDQGPDKRGALSLRSGEDGRPLAPPLLGDPGEELGFVLRPIGDVNRDGRSDFAASGFIGMGQAGRVRVLTFSGHGIKELKTFPGTPGDDFGRSLSGVGDVDTDGYLDLAVGSWPEDRPGYVRVFGGRTWEPLAEAKGVLPGDKFGVVLVGLRVSDGYPALAIGVPQRDGFHVLVYLITPAR